MCVAEIQRAVLRDFPIRAERQPGAILIGNTRCAEFIRHRTLVVSDAGAQRPRAGGFIAAADSNADAVVPFFCRYVVWRIVVKLNA